jgi:hypothetical protein
MVYCIMPPKKIVLVNESNESNEINENNKGMVPVKKTRTKKIAQDNPETAKTSDVMIEPVKKTRAKKIVSNENDKKVILDKNDKKVIPVEDSTKVSDEPVKKTRSKKIVTVDIVEADVVISSKTNKIQKLDKSVKSVEIVPISDVSDTVKCDDSTESNLVGDSDSDYDILKTEWSILCEQMIALNKKKGELEIRKGILLNKLWKLGEDTKPKSNNLHTLESIKSVGISQSKILENNSDSDDSDSSDSSESESESDSDDNIKKPKVVRKSSGKVSDSSDSD